MLVVLGLIVAFILVVVFSNRETRQCRWRKERSGDRDGLKKYRCAACGAETFTDGSTPKTCLAGRRI